MVAPTDRPMLENVSRIDREAFGAEGLGPCNLALLARCGSVFVLAEENRVTAEALVIWNVNGAGALLLSLAVDSSLRRKGRGKRLMIDVLAHCSAAGKTYLELTVAPDNIAALSLYLDRLGFSREEHLPEYFGPGGDRLLLIKKL